MLGGEVVERHPFVEIVGDRRDGLGELRPVTGLERARGVEGSAPEHVGDLVDAMPDVDLV